MSPAVISYFLEIIAFIGHYQKKGENGLQNFAELIQNNINLKEHPIRQMEIEQSQICSVFDPIDKFPYANIYNHKITVENQFSSTQHSQEKILLTLFGSVLTYSDLTEEEVTPKYAVNLNFDLKFQIIYETPRNVNSTKRGFKLFTTEGGSIQLYSTSPAVVEAWTIFLSRKINQNGFHDIFRPLKKLGKGNFASVYQVQRISDRRKYAVKAFSKIQAFNAKNGKESLINQLTIMRDLSTDYHQNVLRLQGVYESQNSIYIVLQLLTGGQLFHKIQQKNGVFSPAEIKYFMVGLLKGLQFLHQRRIIHRDLKPQNIMLRNSHSMSPVIVDFGLATPADLDKYLFYRCGTPGYVAPQIIELSDNKHIQPQCDIFSAGVIFHILLTRRTLFEGSKYEQVYKKNKQMNISFGDELYGRLDREALDLMKKMLKENPAQRISAKQALGSKYFSDCEYLQKQPLSPVTTDAGVPTCFNKKQRNFSMA